MNKNTFTNISAKNNIGLSNLQIKDFLYDKEEVFDFEKIKNIFEEKLKEKHNKVIKIENFLYHKNDFIM